MMLRGLVAAAMTGWIAMVGGAGASERTVAALPSGTFATLNGTTSVPFGWVDFCERYAGECDGPALAAQDVVLTPRSLRDVERIDRAVNKAVAPVTDMAHWGVVDRWDYPTDGRGDCEDYALEKRRQLIAAGYPRQALLMTVVKDHAGDGHAVLTVKTDRGEFVLDNMTDAVLPSGDTGYRFVKRQSQRDPNVWESIGPATTAPLYAAR